MSQLVVSVDDNSLLESIKNAIKMLRGVKEVEICEECNIPNEETRMAIEAARKGELIYCSDFEEYLEKVK